MQRRTWWRAWVAAVVLGTAAACGDGVERTGEAPAAPPGDTAHVEQAVDGEVMTLTFDAAADATVTRATPDTRLGLETRLRSDGSPEEWTYLKFHVTGVDTLEAQGWSFGGATLRVHVSEGTNQFVALYDGPDRSDWSESTLTWNTRPAGGLLYDDYRDKRGPVASGTTLELDATPDTGGDLDDGPLTVILAPHDADRCCVSTDGISFISRNSSQTTLRPRLTVRLTRAGGEEPPPPTTTTRTYAPVADAHVAEAAPSSTYATSSLLQVDAGPAEHAYLRFDLQGLAGTVTGAKLRLYVLNGSTGGPYLHTTGAWTATPTWSTRPSTGTRLAHLTGASTNTWAELDVTSVVKGNGAVYLGFLPSSSDGLDFASLEHSNPALRPQLVVTTSGSGGSEPPPPATQELRLAPTADASARAGTPGSNFGSQSTLYVDQSPDDETFLRFRVQGVTGKVTRALLRVYALNGSSAGPRLFRTSTSWAEAGLTWSTRPARTSAELGRDSGAAGTWFEYDVTGQLPSEGDVSFVLAPASTDGADFASRETADASRRPQLVLTVETPTTTGGRVEAAHAYERGSRANGPLAHHAATGDVLLSWGGTGEVTFERRTALNVAVWSHTWRIQPLPPPPPGHETDTENPSGQVLAAAFAPDGSVWLVLKYLWGTLDFGAADEPPGVYLLQLSPEGELNVVRPFSQQGRGPGATPWALDVDGTGHVVLTGDFASGADFGAGPVAGVADAQASGFVARYTPQGTLHWVRVFGNTVWGVGMDVATGPSGEVLVGGRTQGQDRGTFDGTPIMGDYDAFGGEGVLARLSADGTLQWVKGLGERVEHVALSHLGTAVAVVHAVDPLSWTNGQTPPDTTALVTFEVNGARRWLKAAPRTDVWGLDVDGAGSARVLMEHVDFAGASRPDEERGLALTRVNLDATHVWTTWLPGLMEDTYETGMRPHLAVAPGGQSWVFGSFGGTKTFGDFTLTAPSRQGVLLRLAP